jgi:hypothetical protein
MRVFLLSIFTILAFHSSSFAAPSLSCFNLYMRVNSNDPGQVCIEYPAQLAQGALVGVYLYGFTNTNKNLIEAFAAKIGPSDTAHHGRFGLWTTFSMTGQGKMYSVSLNQFADTNPPAFASIAIRNLQDGNLQNQIVTPSGGYMGNHSCQHCH